MISQTVDYALRAMVALASHYDTVMSVRTLAGLTDVPRPYLSKLMSQLVRAKLVQSRRGVGGGFVLARPPHEISMWDIVQAIDPIQKLHTRPLNIKVQANPLALHELIDRVLDELEQAFRNISLSKVLQQSHDSGSVQSDQSLEQIHDYPLRDANVDPAIEADD